MDISAVNQVVVAVLAILFWNLLPYFSVLFMEACQKLKTLVALRSSLTPDESLVTIETKSLKGEHDVFLSFQGEARNNFVCHLYKELDRRGIPTFIDDKRLEKGKSISPSLIEAIEKSKISIIVFSPNYASSSWCLDELLKIVECMETKQQLVFPLFINVDPSDVKKQRGSFGKAFIKHRINFVRSDRIQEWKDALSKIATIAGCDSRNCFDGNQAELIQFIAGKVSAICMESSSETSSLVGIDSFMMDIDEKLDLKCNDVRMLGIWGTGGIGKTTIAEYIYSRDCSNYEACCLLKGVKDKYKRDGAIVLQKELIFHTLSERDSTIRNENDGCSVIKRLQRKKVLIILDDIDEQEQLEVLANNVGWFGQGSRIIITTRDKSLLVQHGVEHIYEVSFLKQDKALQLFSWHAFKETRPPVSFLELSNKFISYSQGLPLALKVLGCFLYTRDINFWQNQLEKLRRFPDKRIYEVLKISFDGLDDSVKTIFLDIIFFFNDKNLATTVNVLDNLWPQNALVVLKERALLTISFEAYTKRERIEIHDLIKQMGKEIVREECKENPNKRSRLSDPEDIRHVLTNDEEGSPIEGMSLNMSDLTKSIDVKSNKFQRMPRLRILDFYVRGYEMGQRIFLPEGLNYLPSQLRYLRWHDFPLKSLPFTSFGENLVELSLRGSEITHLWDGEMELGNLRILDLSNSRLEALPNLTNVPKIEEIRLCGCGSFNEFSSDIIHLEKLMVLNLIGCKKLGELPKLPPNLAVLYLYSCGIRELPLGFQSLKNLKVLNLDYCKALAFLPSEFGELESLSLLSMGGAAIKVLPPSFCGLKSLKIFRLEDVPLRTLPENIGEMKSLTELSLIRVTIKELPSSIGKLKSLKKLLLYGDAIKELPSSIGKLKSLETLILIGDAINELPSSIGKLKSLKTLYLSGVAIKELPSSIVKLKSLEILHLIGVAIKELPSSIGKLKSLKRLYLRGVQIIELPESTGDLHALGHLELTRCSKLMKLPRSMHRLHSLDSVQIRDCNSLASLPEFLQLFIGLYVQEILQSIKSRGVFPQSRSVTVSHHNKSDTLQIGRYQTFRREGWWEPLESVLFTGDEIPKLIENKRSGSSITIKLPSTLHGTWGLVFCVVCECQGYERGQRCFVRSRAKCDLLDFESSVTSYCSTEDRVAMVWCQELSKEEKERFTAYLGCEIQFDFSVKIEVYSGGKKRELEGKVEKCGVHVICGEEVSSPVIGSVEEKGFNGRA